MFQKIQNQSKNNCYKLIMLVTTSNKKLQRLRSFLLNLDKFRHFQEVNEKDNIYSVMKYHLLFSHEKDDRCVCIQLSGKRYIWNIQYGIDGLLLRMKVAMLKVSAPTSVFHCNSSLWINGLFVPVLKNGLNLGSYVYVIITLTYSQNSTRYYFFKFAIYHYISF